MSPALKQYLESLIQANATIDARGVLQMQQVVELTLDDVFVSLTIRLDAASAHLYQPSLETLQHWSVSEGLAPDSESHVAADYYYLSEQLPKLEHGLSIEQLWERNHYWVILGDPGAGKTTLLKYLVLTHARKMLETEQGFIPIQLSLRLFAHAWRQHPTWSAEDALLAYLKTYGLRELGWDETLLTLAEQLSSELESQLHKLNIILLLDGLDEQHDIRSRHTVNSAIEAFLAAYPGNRCLVSSRIIGYYDAPLHGGFQAATLEHFNEAQIQEFFYLWAYAIEKKDGLYSEEILQQRAIEQADQLVQHIENTAGMRTLATNPLLCTIVSLIYRQSGALPAHRVQLYRLCIDTFIFNWESYKRRQSLQELSLAPEETQDVLEILALHFHEHCPENRSSANDILQIIKQYLTTELGLPDVEASQKAQYLMHVIRHVAGLLVERGNEIYGFFHLTFQEYLAARAILRERQKLRYYLEHYLYQARWREVFLLAAAHQGSLSPELGSEFVELLLHYKHPRDRLAHFTFRFAFLCMRETRVKLPTANKLLKQWVHLFLTQPALEQLLLSLLIRDGTPLRYQPNLLDPLFDLLNNHHDARRRTQVAKALGYFPSQTCIEALQNCLQHDTQEQVRHQVALSLGRVNAVSAIANLTYALEHDPDDEVRQAAAQSLGRIDHPDGLIPLNYLLHAPQLPVSASLKQILIQALGQSPLVEAITILADAVQQTENPELRLTAIEALSHHKTLQAVNLLADILRQETEDTIRIAAADALGKQRNPAAISVLVQVLTHHEDRQIRCRAAEALSSFRFPFAMRALTHALQVDEEASVRWRCARALGRFRGAHVVAALSHALAHDADSWVRWRAAEALWQLQDPSAINVLGHALQNDPDEVVRWRAAEALGNLSGPAAINILLQTLHSDDDSTVLWRVAQALGNLRDPTAAIPLSRALQGHPDPAIRRRAARALANVQQQMAVDGLLYALHYDADEGVRQATAEALGQLLLENTLPDLIQTLREDKDEWVRWSAADAIGNFQTLTAVEALHFTLETDTDEWVRWRATEALGRLQHPEAIRALADTLRHHPDEWVRWRAAAALGNYPHDTAIAALLYALQHDMSLAVKQNAIAAIEKVDIGALL